MKQKGGVQQRIAKAKQQREDFEEETLSKTSILAAYLEKEFAWGAMSGQVVQKIAMCAVRDMEATGCKAVPKRLLKLSELGTRGAHSANVHRDMCSLLEPECPVPQPVQLQLPFNSGQAYQSILLPHEMFSWLYASKPETFADLFMPGGEAVLQDFWAHFQNHPCMDSNDFITSKPDWQKTCLPLAMHGDGVPVTGLGKVWGKAFEVYSWHGLLCRDGGTKFATLLIWAAFQKLFKHGPEGTLSMFFSVLAWSFGALLDGRWPHADWKGDKHLGCLGLLVFSRLTL